MDHSGQKALETTRPYGPWALCVAPMMDRNGADFSLSKSGG
jgi:hypothetical protein